MARSFNGTSNFINSASTVDLSASNLITVSFWLFQNAFSNGDQLAMESSVNFNSNNGTFIVDPNASTGTQKFEFGCHFTGTNTVEFARPTANQWHHYLLLMSLASANNEKAWVDGIAQSVANVTNTNTTGNFGVWTIYLASRAGTGLFNASQMAEVAIWTADESASVASLAAGALASSIDPANLKAYVKLCGINSPEPDAIASRLWTVTGASRTGHPTSACSLAAGIGGSDSFTARMGVRPRSEFIA